MTLRRIRRPRRWIPLVLGSLGCALLLAPPAQAGLDGGVRASKLTACKGANAKAIKLRVSNIGCTTAYDKVYNGNQKKGKGCDQPGSGQTCHFRVAGFKCVYEESKNPRGVGVLVKATCQKTLKGKQRKPVKQVVRWEFTFAG